MGTISKKLIESFNYQVNEEDDDEEIALLRKIKALEKSSDPRHQELARQARAKLNVPAAAQPQAAAPATTGQAPAKKPKDPKVAELQTALNAAGAKLDVDGIMGPQTQAAMSANPAVAAKFSGLSNGTGDPKVSRFKELVSRLGL